MNLEDYFILQKESIDKRINGDSIGEYAKLAEENSENFNPSFYCSIPIAAPKEILSKYAVSFSIEPILLDGENAICLKFSQNNMIPEIWVKKKYNGYRDIFKKFVKTNYQITSSFTSNYDIDHVLSRGQVKDPNTYIRLMLVDYKVNRSHGASTEKGFAQNTIKTLNQENLNAIAYLKVKGEKFTKGLWEKYRTNEIQLLKEWMPNETIAEMILQYLKDLSFNQFKPDDTLDYITQMEQFRINSD